MHRTFSYLPSSHHFPRRSQSCLLSTIVVFWYDPPRHYCMYRHQTHTYTHNNNTHRILYVPHPSPFRSDHLGYDTTSLSRRRPSLFTSILSFLMLNNTPTTRAWYTPRSLKLTQWIPPSSRGYLNYICVYHVNARTVCLFVPQRFQTTHLHDPTQPQPHDAVSDITLNIIPSVSPPRPL